MHSNQPVERERSVNGNQRQKRGLSRKAQALEQPQALALGLAPHSYPSPAQTQPKTPQKANLTGPISF
jgi:hypothetical protein